MPPSFKVLVSAYACNPYIGSEEGVGWGWVRAMAQYHQLWVITAEFHRADLETAQNETPDLFKHIKFIYVPHRPWHYTPTKAWLFFEGSILKPIMNYAYRLWQRDAFQVAKNLNRKIHFDLTHQITYVGFRFPGHLWKLNAPFVWGPIGGLENTPPQFLPELGPQGFIYYACRNIINSIDKRFLPGPKKAFKRARGGIIAATNGIRKEILRWYGVDSEVICEIGPPSDIAQDFTRRKPGEFLKLAWSGQHLPGKALPLLLHALFRLPSEIRWQIDILGQGPYTQKWQQLTRELGVDRRCKWHGQIPRSEAIKRVHRSHLFIITSLKDLTSTVLLEAFSQGVPIICPDHCGFADVVTDNCGIKIAVHTPRQFAIDLADAITLLAKDEECRRKLAKGALQRIEDFSWEKKARQVNLIYRRIVDKGL